jgi:hypothetical protein
VRDADLWAGLALATGITIFVSAYLYQPAPAVEKVIQVEYRCPTYDDYQTRETIQNYQDAQFAVYYLTPLKKGD